MSSILPNTSQLKESSTLDSAQVQELNDVRECLKASREKYMKYKIITECVQECVSKDNCLPVDVKKKIETILLQNDCAQLVDLDDCQGSTDSVHKLLGLVSLGDKETLNYTESLQLRKALVDQLNEKYNSIHEEFSKITEKSLNVVLAEATSPQSICLSGDDEGLVTLERKLNEQNQLYLNNIQKEQTLLEDLVKLRQDNLTEACNKKINEAKLESQKNELKYKILKQRTRVTIFMENRHSLNAYKELLKDLKDQQMKCQAEIAYLQQLKIKYKHVSCKQYDDILKSYTQYKSAIARIKQICESL